MSQLIELIRLQVRSASDKILMAKASQLNIKGDFLTDPRDLNQAFYYSETIVREIHEKYSGILKHRPYAVIRKDDTVTIVHKAAGHGEDYNVCSYSKIIIEKSKSTTMTTTDSKMIPLKDIKPDPSQPRKYFDQASIDELSESASRHGILQAILLRPSGGKYMIVFGERRYKAAIKAGLTEIPATIKNLSNEEALEIQLVENLHRENPHPMEEAVAFQAYLKMKGYSIEELAAKMGKKVFYIKQRIKLNDLTKDWQQLFFNNGLMITDALKIAQLAQEDQEDYYFEEVANSSESMKPGYKFELNDWDLNKYKGDLKKATFDLTDKTLNPKLGACGTCVFNTAYATLFADSEAPRCNNITCFKLKTKTSFDLKFKEAKNDSTIVFVSVGHGADKQAAVKELAKKEMPVLSEGKDLEFIDVPEKPEWEEFKDDNVHMEYTDEEMAAEFQKSLQQYDKELRDYEKKIATGKCQKAFVIDGSNAGTYQFVELKKSDLAAALSSDPNEAIKQEINRIIVAEEEAAEQDAIAIHKKVKLHLQEYQPFLDNGNMLGMEELIALTIMNFDYGSNCEILVKQFKVNSRDKLELYKKIQKTPQPQAMAIMNKFLRTLIVSRMATKDARDSPDTSGAAAAIRDIAEHNFPSIVNEIRLEHNKVSAKRSSAAEEKIKGLKGQLDTARPTKKKVVKS